MKDLLIGIDIGTMGIRSMLYDIELTEVGKSYIPYPLINISATEIEQDANLWWDITKRTLSDSIKDANGKIRAISVSSQGIAFVPVDENCVPLRNAISWLDNRSDVQLHQILDVCEEKDIYNITGKSAASFYTLPKVLWLRENEPENYEKAYKILLPHDFIIAKLCGEFVTDHSMAAGTMMYDINKQQWSSTLCDQFEIAEGKLPKIYWSASVAGKILPNVAEELGLPNDVVICVGGQDQKCAAFGAGIGDGIATVSLGTAAAIEKKWGNPHKNASMHIPCFSFLFEKSWVTEGVLNTAAACLRWLKETLFEDYSYDQMSAMVENQTEYQTNLCFFPYLAGCGTPNWYKDATGMFSGIHLNTSRKDFVRALFEGVAMQIRCNLDEMEGVDELRVFGGGAVSSAWCSIIADITGNVVKIPQTAETACSGAAMLAGIGSNVFQDVNQASKSISISKVYMPNVARCTYYNQKYLYYQDTEKKLWD